MGCSSFGCGFNSYIHRAYTADAAEHNWPDSWLQAHRSGLVCAARSSNRPSDNLLARENAVFPPVNSKFHHKTVVFIIFTKTNKNTAKNSLFSTQYSLWHGMGNMVLYIRKPCTIFFMKKLQSGVKINDLCIGTENIFIFPRLFFQEGRVPRRIFCEYRSAIAFVIPGKPLSKKKIQY